MIEQVKILTSRRAYEFNADALRLTTLSIQPIQQQVQQLFGFQSSAIGTPMQTFGEVPVTFPPGVVFYLGAWIHQEEQIIPIRFINFEQNRIVIDVAGPTAAIDGIADRLFGFLSDLQSADGSPVVGEPERVLNYSEITAKYPFPLDVVFVQPLRKLLSNQTGVGGKGLALVPSLVAQAISEEQVISVLPTYAHGTFTFSLRSGTRPDEHIYFSSAPLDSEAHLSYLRELEAALQS